MSITKITVERINEVTHHPEADRLDIIQVLGYKVVCGRDQFKVGDAAIYFPPDILLPPSVTEELGVTKYLKHSVYPGDARKTQCRVSACRLRGLPSHGFIVGPVEHSGVFGVDLTQRYGGYKYEPPIRLGAGDAACELPSFHPYTNIENIQRYPDRIPEGTDVRVTEKLHGSSNRMGLVRESGGFEFVAGSHKVRRKDGLYWSHCNDHVKALLTDLSGGQHDVIVFGEIFGRGIQDLDYAMSVPVFRVFDISINGKYMDWDDVATLCEKHSIKTVPLLYRGPFSLAKVEELTYGPTTLAQPEHIQSKFKGREGCVITPLQEQISRTGHRVILKSVSADYRDRKGAKDIE